ncbi:hypothetical protein DPMN_099070 [Dreissena polymorpha]|uniref:Uncharacterized protein n=1 Tax=Dreissena polymorpha TaxID=45954 RepID=A0A9D4LGF8_DREPO|nr:hypothetical protein DPMN_099070 [Dreissena polymorpha]
MSIWSWSRGRQRLERVQLTKQELCGQEFGPTMKTHPNVWSQLTEYMRKTAPSVFRAQRPILLVNKYKSQHQCDYCY